MSKFVCIYHVREQILRKKFEISCNLSLDAMEVSELCGLLRTRRGWGWAVRARGQDGPGSRREQTPMLVPLTEALGVL